MLIASINMFSHLTLVVPRWKQLFKENGNTLNQVEFRYSAIYAILLYCNPLVTLSCASATCWKSPHMWSIQQVHHGLPTQSFSIDANRRWNGSCHTLLPKFIIFGNHNGEKGFCRQNELQISPSFRTGQTSAGAPLTIDIMTCPLESTKVSWAGWYALVYKRAMCKIKCNDGCLLLVNTIHFLPSIFCAFVRSSIFCKTGRLAQQLR